MKLPAEFLRLPVQFDAERLAEEIDAVPQEDWQPHPQGFPGNDALILVSAGGGLHNDELTGAMQPTSALARCAYLRQVMAAFRTVIGRSRLMRIAGAAEASPHFDLNYYWHQRMRIHVPIRTHPDVRFHCGERAIHMAPGECWVFDTWKIHKVTNPADYPRIHLVCDTVGSGPFWDLLAGALDPFASQSREFLPGRIDYRPDHQPVLHFETVNAPEVMTPWEQESLLAVLLDDLAAVDPPAETFRQFQARLERFRFHWRGLWARFGASPRGHRAYALALEELSAQMQEMRGQLALPNRADPADIVLKVIIERSLMQRPRPDDAPPPSGPRQEPPRLRQPVLIAAAPRSGSTLLFETLAGSPELVSIGGESHGVIERISGLAPGDRNFDSNALRADDASPERIRTLRKRFLEAVIEHESAARLRSLGQDLRLLEKTPKNALRLGFLLKVFPGARLLYLVRDPRENISSIIDAWRSGRFVTYPRLPGWSGPPWSLLLVPGWRSLDPSDLATIAAYQWQSAHDAMLDVLEGLDAGRVVAVRYEDLRARPQPVVERVCRRLAIQPPELGESLPLSRHTLTAPDPHKWQRNAADLERVLPAVESTWRRVQRFLERLDA